MDILSIRDCIALSSSGVIFNSETGDSFSLNPSAQIMLEGIKNKKQKDEIMLTVLSKFKNIDERTFEKDYFDFITHLINHNIITKTV